MNIKSITTLGLVAVALAVTSIAPAEANNNKALNQMAMQMYMQNQATAANSSIYNPALLANYANPYAVTVNPWSTATAAYPYASAGNYGCNRAYNNGYNNIAYNAPVYTNPGYRNIQNINHPWHESLRNRFFR